MKVNGKIKFSFLIVLASFFVFVSFIVYPPGVKIIFKNKTQEDFKELKVNIRGQEFSFFDLKSGETTKPVRVSGSYSYCYAQAITLKDTLICQPIDYVGEKLYTRGKLIMDIVIIDGTERRFLTIR